MKKNFIIVIYYIIIIIIITINCKWVYNRWQCATMTDRTVQYSTVKYNKIQQNNTSRIITHIVKIRYSTQDNTLCKQNCKKFKNIYSIKTQKRVEPK